MPHTPIAAYVAGIPCLVQPTHVNVVKGDSRADSDWDYYGYTELEFTVLDRRGRPAPWLERKLTPAITRELEALILETLEA